MDGPPREDPIAVGDICEQIGISPRHLERGCSRCNWAKAPSFTTVRKRLMCCVRQLVIVFQSPRCARLLCPLWLCQPRRACRRRYAEAYGPHVPEDDRDRINIFRVQQNAASPVQLTNEK